MANFVLAGYHVVITRGRHSKPLLSGVQRAQQASLPQFVFLLAGYKNFVRIYSCKQHLCCEIQSLTRPPDVSQFRKRPTTLLALASPSTLKVHGLDRLQVRIIILQRSMAGSLTPIQTSHLQILLLNALLLMPLHCDLLLWIVIVQTVWPGPGRHSRRQVQTRQQLRSPSDGAADHMAALPSLPILAASPVSIPTRCPVQSPHLNLHLHLRQNERISRPRQDLWHTPSNALPNMNVNNAPSDPILNDRLVHRLGTRRRTPRLPLRALRRAVCDPPKHRTQRPHPHHSWRLLLRRAPARPHVRQGAQGWPRCGA